MIKVSFAATRPDGAYALAIPVRGEDMLHDRLGGLDPAARTLAVRAADAQRFERETAAVAEAFVGGQWRVVDATCLAPRSTLVRISVGRDAADTAFLDNHKGAITLNSSVVTAVVDGDLPHDDITELVSLT